MIQSKRRAIPVREKLQDRYQIKEVLGENGFTITYRAYDTFRNKKVLIKELFPAKIVRRDQLEHYKVECLHVSEEAVFDSMKEQVIKEAKMLIQLYPLEGIANVITFFEENKTVYTVSEYIEGVTLDIFLEGKKTGKLPLMSLLNFFEPITESLKKIHEAGLIHGKIRPDQIMITKKNGAKLIGFCDPMKEAVNPLFVEEMIPIRNSRYAPVELFMEEGTLDSATDVYGLATTIYHCITGIMPPHFYDRIQNTEKLRTPLELKIPIGKEQNKTLLAGLASHDFERIQTVEALLEGLSVEDEEEKGQEKEPPKPIILYKDPFVLIKRKTGITLKKILAAVIIIIVLCLIPVGIHNMKEYQVKHFYETLLNASDYEKCILLRGINDKKRSRYANDYNVMEEGEKVTIKYYDCKKGIVITKEEMDITQKYYEYISVDFRPGKKAIVTSYKPDGMTVWEVNLLKTEEYFQVTKKLMKDGRAVETEELQVGP